MHVFEQNDWYCRLCGQSLTKGPLARPDSNVVLSVLIPVHNESDLMAQNLSLMDEEALKTALPMEMIVIDDGSTDGTCKLWKA